MSRRRKKTFLKKLGRQVSSHFELDLSEDVVRDIFAVLWIVIGLIVLLAEFNSAGILGQQIFRMLRVLVGWEAFIICVIFLWIGLAIGEFFGVRFKFRQVIGATLLFVFLPILFHLLIGGDPLVAARAGRGGGLFGYSLSFHLSRLIGSVGTYVTSLAALLIGLLFLLNLPIKTLWRGLVSGRSDEEPDVEQSVSPSFFQSFKRTIGGLRENIRPAKARVLEMPQPTIRPFSQPSGSSYVLPQVDLLELSGQVASSGNINKNVEIIQKTLKDFGISVTMSDVNVGPTVTQYTMKPAEGVKLSQITARANDLALALAAKSIRIEAPIPGKSLVGVEIPNKVPAKVTLREVLESKAYLESTSPLTIALGRDVAGAPVICDLEKMPHLLIAGATGSGKSVCINSIILSFLMRNTPADLRFIMVDPKRVELTNYNGIPHLLSPVVTSADKTVAALKWTVAEMDRRYRLFSETGKRNIAAYNESSKEKMPYIVYIIDELADLMAVSAREVEGSIVRLSQMARATGIHLVVATQRPSVDVITGLIKANITTRIAFAVASNADSRTILDQGGAEKLLGNGDMLFVGSDLSKPRRVQGCFASDKDIAAVINHVSSQDVAHYNDEVTELRSASGMRELGNGSAEDDLYNEAVETVRSAGKASASLLQRRLRIGYARAARLLDLLEESGIIGPADGAKPREVYGRTEIDSYQE